MTDEMRGGERRLIESTSRESGFTLIEALVALVILAIASSALMAATGAHIQRVSRLEARAVAQLVAENAMAELRIAHSRPGATTEHVSMSNRDWGVQITAEPTSDVNLINTKIAISEVGTEDVLLVLQGFIDAGGES